MAKGYWMSAYREILDPEKLAAYAAIAGEAVRENGGHFLARGGQMEPKEHAVAERTVLVEFESLEKAKDFYYGSDYQLALKALDGGADRDIRIFEGK